VLGVSPDGPSEHVKFKEKYGLPFTLLSDEEHTVADQYGTWVERQDVPGHGAVDVRHRRGRERRRECGKVKPEHADDVLAALP
jgi:peroxiredoxin